MENASHAVTHADVQQHTDSRYSFPKLNRTSENRTSICHIAISICSYCHASFQRAPYLIPSITFF